MISEAKKMLLFFVKQNNYFLNTREKSSCGKQKKMFCHNILTHNSPKYLEWDLA